MNSRVIEIRYSPWAPVLYIAFSALAIPVGLLAMLYQWWDLIFLFSVGIIILVYGIRLLSRPYCIYDLDQKAIVVYWFATRRPRWVFGEPKGERLTVEDGRIRRVPSDGGRTKSVVLLGCDPRDVERVVNIVRSQERSRQAKERGKHR